MKSTGLIRRIDELGRVVIPIEIRTQFGISEKDPLEIHVDGQYIMLRKYSPNCMFCGSSKKLYEFEGNQICKKCAENINKLAKD